MPDVIVVGAGVIGASVAYYLAMAGAGVTILDADRPAGGTSTRSFAWVNAHNKPPRAYHDLNVAGMTAHAALVREAGGAWLHPGGCIEWTHDAEGVVRQRERVARLRAWGYAAEWITPAELLELEPDIDRAAVGDAAVAYYPEEAWLDPAIYVCALIRRALALGAVLRSGARVVDVVRSGGTVTGVRLVSGETVPGEVVVNCAGPATNSLTPDIGLHVPMASNLGLLVITAPSATTLRRVIQGPTGLAIRPDGAGRLMLHCNEADTTIDAGTVPGPGLPQAAELVARATRVLPAIAGVVAEAARIAVRPIPQGGHPAVGPIPGVGGYYVAATHSGVTLAPMLGKCIADEVLGGIVRPELAPFRPARFFQMSAATAAS